MHCKTLLIRVLSNRLQIKYYKFIQNLSKFCSHFVAKFASLWYYFNKEDIKFFHCIYIGGKNEFWYYIYSKSNRKVMWFGK